ncbi:MAG: allantoicase [Cyanobacteria bacterium]|nr:allantoicase [Cyanobacteriota bacterium]
MERGFNLEAAVFTGLIDLAAEALGGKVLLASDEFFAEKENLIKPGRGVYLPDEYTDRGKWMDGWETRRKRVPGHDWCIIKLGAPGRIRGVDVDTNHFLGNSPSYASMDAVCIDDDVLASGNFDEDKWVEIMPKSALKQASQNIFTVLEDERTWTHVRLHIYPDGGVARLRVYGDVVRDWSKLGPDELVDLAALENGGLVIGCNDMFFGNKNNMILPGRAVNMGGGWETRRRRDLPGHDWAIVKLSRDGLVRKIEVDTNHYKGNYPDSCWIEGCASDGKEIDNLNAASFNWVEILPETKLKADTRHYYEKELTSEGPYSHIRISIRPDGGVSRLRVHCTLPKTAAKSDKKESDELKSYQRA